jgi:HK97 family phage prohead protease
MTMPQKFVDQRRFRDLAAAGDTAGAVVEHLGSVVRSSALGPRTRRFCFSDGAEDRMGDKINVRGWETANFLRNPVCLYAHDSSAPPVGKVVNIFVSGDRLMGDIKFAPPEVYEFADTIFKLIDAEFLNSVSVGFLPLEFEFADDRRGMNFIRQELLEISVVPVPANAHALIEAQAKSWGRSSAASPERPTPALSVMQYSGTSRDRKWFLANALKQAIRG